MTSPHSDFISNSGNQLLHKEAYSSATQSKRQRSNSSLDKGDNSSSAQLKRQGVTLFSYLDYKNSPFSDNVRNDVCDQSADAISAAMASAVLQSLVKIASMRCKFHIQNSMEFLSHQFSGHVVGFLL